MTVSNQQLPLVGQPVNTFGQPINTFGQAINTFGQPINALGQGINTFGQPLNTFGQPLNTFGQPLNTFGQPLNTFGQPINGYRQSAMVPVNTFGQPINTFGQPINRFGQSVMVPTNISGQAINTFGQPSQSINGFNQPMNRFGQSTNVHVNNNTIRNYQLGQELGRGTFGVTYLGYDTINGRQVAVKTIDINKSRQMGADMDSINEEINTLQDLSGNDCSKYIACYYESFQDTFNGVDTMFIISEYINGGSLTDFIKQNNGNIYPSILWSLYLQMLLGLEFIHERGYAHRDIKPDNILITEDYTIKYIDFGLTCLQRCKVMSCTNTCKGTPGTLLYMPPEFFNGSREDSLISSKAHDMWSLGLVMFEMAHGLNMYPFQIFTPDGSAVLPNEQMMANIAQAPAFSSNYTLDDGRTNFFLSTILINNWHARPTVEMSQNILRDNILAKVWIPMSPN